MNAHPDASVVQMDLVESIRGIDDPYLLTLHFTKFRFQIAYLIPSKASLNIAAVLDMLTKDLGINMFQRLFQVILTDNGIEFSDPDSIEVYSETGEIRTQVFYCHPYSSFEKGSCEKNHEFIRYIKPKNTSLSDLTQEKVYLMMSRINSIIRPGSLATPYDMMALCYGKNIIDRLHIKKIPAKEVVLSDEIFKCPDNK